MHTRIAGIPCQAQITHISGRYVPAKTNADPDDCYPASYPEVEWEVLDRKGYAAPWLAKKMTTEDMDRIETELLGELE